MTSAFNRKPSHWPPPDFMSAKATGIPQTQQHASFTFPCSLLYKYHVPHYSACFPYSSADAYTCRMGISLVLALLQHTKDADNAVYQERDLMRH
jgi:hypothetical protein